MRLLLILSFLMGVLWSAKSARQTTKIASKTNKGGKYLKLSYEDGKTTYVKIILLTGKGVWDVHANNVTNSGKSLTAVARRRNNTLSTGAPKDSDLGVAQIFLNGEGLLCSGTLLKSWIVLTTGKCLEHRSVSELYAVITVKNLQSNELTSVTVDVASVLIYPLYHDEGEMFNFALVRIYSEFAWEVKEFFLPRGYLSSEPLYYEKKDDTYVSRWNPAKAFWEVTTPATPSMNFSICGELDDMMYWYCSESAKSKAEAFENKDIGTPFFLKSGGLKRLLGIYTGLHMYKSFEGHLYLSVFPVIDWLDEFIYNNPLPPFDFD